MMAAMETSAHHGRGRLFAERRAAICCDVLDAWFDPSSHAVEAFGTTGLDMRTSPEADGRPLVEAIAEARNIDPDCINIGAGSSEIMYRVLPRLYGEGPVVILDPSYSEYTYLLRRDGRQIKPFQLNEQSRFRPSVSALIDACQDASLVILVNPNNPTGQALLKPEILRLKEAMPKQAALWIDEAYVDYGGPVCSVETEACQIEGLFVLKSLSKAYALSGVRAAYFVSRPEAAREIAKTTPPWIVGTSAQAAAAAAVRDSEYYTAKWLESAFILAEFSTHLRSLGLTVYSGQINAALVETPPHTTATCWAHDLADAGLIVRTPVGMGEVLGERYIRIGLVERRLWPRILQIIASCMERGL